jgi:hypothetical protein
MTIPLGTGMFDFHATRWHKSPAIESILPCCNIGDDKRRQPARRELGRYQLWLAENPT